MSGMKGLMALSLLSSVAMSASSVAALADEISYPYNLAASACKIIALPVSNAPVHVMGVESANSDPGVANVTIMRDTLDAELAWVGVDLASNWNTSASISKGISGTAGTHIASLDLAGGVDLQVQNASHFKVCNGLPVSSRGTVTLFW